MTYPTPVAGDWNGCPPEGDGGDPDLNRRKNRIDQGTWQPVDFTFMLGLPAPAGIKRAPRSKWGSRNAAAIAQYEGRPVQLEGYVWAAHPEGPEACNCHGVGHEWADNHVWIVEQPDCGRERAVVVETTPRVRCNYPGWTAQALNEAAAYHERVRISGWLLCDQEHPDQVGKTRGTIWEIHPVLQIDVWRNDQWIRL